MSLPPAFTASQPALLPGVPDKRLGRFGQRKRSTARKLVGRFLMLGGGLQSMTLVYMLAEGLLPPVDMALYADTGDDPWWVRQAVGGIARSLLAKAGAQLEIHGAVCSGKGVGLWAEMLRGGPRGSMPVWVKGPSKDKPGRLARQCTREYKVRPNNRAMRLWLLRQGHLKLPSGWTYEPRYHWLDSNYVMRYQGSVEHDPGNWPTLRAPRNIVVELWFGITTDERARIRNIARSLPGWQRARFPLVDMNMSRVDCERWVHEQGYPLPPKSACVQCPYRSDESWLWLQTHAPDEFEQACAIDDALRSERVSSRGPYSKIRGTMYLHQSCWPLREIDLAALVAAKRRPSASLFELETLDEDGCNGDGGFSCMS